MQIIEFTLFSEQDQSDDACFDVNCICYFYRGTSFNLEMMVRTWLIQTGLTKRMSSAVITDYRSRSIV